MNFDLKHLEVFCEIVRQQSFSRAALAVHLTQASVSERIANLESSVGAKLLERSGRRISPTPVGKQLYERAVRLLKQKEDLCVEIEEFLGVRRGSLSVAASHTSAGFYLPRAMARFREAHPEVTFSVAVAGSSEVVDLVGSGQAELGIVGSRGGIQGVRHILRTGPALWDDPMVLAVPAGHPWAKRRTVKKSELVEVPFIVREPGSGTRQWIERYLNDKLPHGINSLDIVAEIGSGGGVKEAVKSGMGVAFLPACTIAAEVSSGELVAVELDGEHLVRQFFIVSDGRRTASPLCRAFMTFLLAGRAVAAEPGAAEPEPAEVS